MIWLALEQSDHNALYLDVHHIEQTPDGPQPRTLLSATLGDGCNEGEVLIELGLNEAVTFADMLPDSGLRPLLRAHGETALKEALLQACQPVAASEGRRIDRPCRNQANDPQLHLFSRTEPQGVAEAGPIWSSATTEPASTRL